MLPIGDQIEVLIHQDDSVLHVREGGLFVTHIRENNKSVQPLRSFTSDTIPFSVPDTKFPLAAPRINLQEILVDAYLMLKQP